MSKRKTNKQTVWYIIVQANVCVQVQEIHVYLYKENQKLRGAQRATENVVHHSLLSDSSVENTWNTKQVICHDCHNISVQSNSTTNVLLNPIVLIVFSSIVAGAQF